VGGALDGDGSRAGVPHAALLVEFGEAMLSGDEPRRGAAREAVHAALGAAALVDAAAVVASFNAVVKLADACGIPLEDFKAEATADLRAELQLEKLNHLSE
jgi:tRNA C32,U32 (ribose-2'-O)-methylase TrmJ